MSSHSIIGLMSGTSMDGLDISFCNYSEQTQDRWSHEVISTHCYKYPSILLEKLTKATSLNPNKLLELDKEIGAFFAESVLTFMNQFNIQKEDVDAIASHGHTIFHQPEKGYTLQIGCGETIAFKTGIRVINDFRQKDVVAGGQGAPLAPIGDALLFVDMAESFLNIGGFVNICIPKERILAFDICPGNLPMNVIASFLGRPFDEHGNFARKGAIDTTLLNQLNGLMYYQKNAPKSLGTEWLNAFFNPILDNYPWHTDALRTIVEHIAIQINSVLSKNQVNSVLITGGGAKNEFLISRIKNLYKGEVIIPKEALVDYKEAIIFGFLGALYLSDKTNVRADATGASRDVKGGVLHLP